MLGQKVMLDYDEMFRPPVNRSMRILDRSFFKKKVPLAAAQVLDNRRIPEVRTALKEDILRVERISAVRVDPETKDKKTGAKSLYLKPEIRPTDTSTWSTKLHQLVTENQVHVLPVELDLNYDYWTYYDIISSILPLDDHDNIPKGFTVAGHIAHLNLREPYLPYKKLIADIIVDKNPNVRTVINKTEKVGMHSEYRTFSYEVLAGDPSMDVEVKEAECIFRFDYSKVYWNSRLSTEHERLVKRFCQGEAVCDVMAGVGPFAVPAGKQKVFVWANDLNPDSYESLVQAISVNKVLPFVRPFNEDGRNFIRIATQKLLGQRYSVDLSTLKRVRRDGQTKQPEPEILAQPKTFAHYVMNLPASATSFLDAFIGIYVGQENLFVPNTTTKLPMVHVYCFSTKSEDDKPERIKICKEISERIGYIIKPEDEEVEIWNVRETAPSVCIFCASFRLPPEVAFRVVDKL
ncbi:MAG: tRNA(m(1)G37)methyltransferase [Icmadophila ericetorum]|nr:tRNA(m(1)G37)methyltransferase [Icmadophila ericetorum]